MQPIPKGYKRTEYLHAVVPRAHEPKDEKLRGRLTVVRPATQALSYAGQAAFLDFTPVD
jgi:hypothetical protein